MVKKNKKQGEETLKKTLYSEALISGRRSTPRSVLEQPVTAVAKQSHPVRHARKCCGKLPVSVSGKISAANFSSEEVARARDASFCFGGDSLLHALTVRENAVFEIVKDKIVRRTLWASTRHMEYLGQLVQLPAGSKVYLVAPKVAGMIRCARMRLDGRSWWKRSDYAALSAAFERSITKISTVSKAPQFLSGKTRRSRRRNHRGKGSLMRRRQRRREAVSKLKEIAKRNQATTQAAATALLEQQSVVLNKDTYKVASEYLAEVVSLKGPHIDSSVPEEKIPGLNPFAVEARSNIVGYISKNYSKPIPMPKVYLQASHTLQTTPTRRNVPQFIVMRDDHLALVYSSGEEQIIVPITTSQTDVLYLADRYDVEMMTRVQHALFNDSKKVKRPGLARYKPPEKPTTLYGFKVRQA